MQEADVLKRIEELCAERGWSLYRLAQESGVPHNTIYNMMNRTTMPAMSTIFKLCGGLGISISQFFMEDDSNWVELTAEQKKILQIYNRMDERKRELFLTYLTGLSE